MVPEFQTMTRAIIRWIAGMKRTRKQYPPALKAKMVLEALRETKTLSELASDHQIRPNLMTKWKQTVVADLDTLFERGADRDNKAATQEDRIAQLYQDIGKLTTQVNSLKRKSGLDPEP